MKFKLSYKETSLGLLDIGPKEYTVDTVTDAKHKKVLDRILKEVYLNGIFSDLHAQHVIRQIIRPAEKEFLLILSGRLSRLGYTLS
ncbi:hypothetical protein KBA73_03765 [Patescibacteria group bacterium]|nr:hypothetical protein [Patescibacteria group bacterium]